MRFYEFADPKTYTLTTDDMAAIIKQVKRVWRDHGIEADAPMILRIMDEPEDRSESIEARKCQVD